MLSIYVPTFMHEKYIAQALDSILMQKTQYKYEVLIGDDASWDNTPIILKKYEQQYPHIFKVFYRKKNMNKSKPNNFDDLKMRCKGKYIICLEGDDFWTDPYKIEKQITFLETHPEYIAVAHNCIIVDDNSKPLKNNHYIECTDNIYTMKHFFSKIYPGQTTTIMYKNFIINDLFDTSLIFYGHGAGDARIIFSLICHGKIYCIQEQMSAYRKSNSAFSFCNNYKFNYLTEKNIRIDFINYAYKINNIRAITLTKIQYIDLLFRALRKNRINLSEFFTEIYSIKHKKKLLFMLFKQKFNRFILQKKLWSY